MCLYIVSLLDAARICVKVNSFLADKNIVAVFGDCANKKGFYYFNRAHAQTLADRFNDNFALIDKKSLAKESVYKALYSE